jgi:predicted Zn-dependent protease
MGVYNDPALQEYVSEIGLRMAKTSERPQLPWKFTVVDVPAVNAFAVPGGAIYITRGIMPFLDNEAELAGVLGHEIGHVTARHSAQQYTRQVSGQFGLLALGIFVPAARPFGELSAQALGIMFLKYGRDDEVQADALGARYAATHAWDPAGVPAFLSTLARLDEAAGERRGVPNWLSTHPDPASRVQDVQPVVEKLRVAGGEFSTSREAFLQRIDGIVYGDNPEQGLARGRTFLHPVLRFRIDFPERWEIANSPRQVTAKAPGADVFMILQLVEQPRGRDIEDVALNSMNAAGFRGVQGERASIDGLDAFIGVYQGQAEGLGAVGVRAGHIAYDGKIYLVAGLVEIDAFQQVDGAFVSTIRSFRRLAASEAEAIRPDRLDFYVVRQGDTWASIAEKFGSIIKPETLAVMNKSTIAMPPQTGSRIKVAVSGN